jgi:multiple sugar transport system permease protein
MNAIATATTSRAPSPATAPPADGTRPRTGRMRLGSTVFHVVAGGATLVVLYPIVWMLISSLKDSSAVIGGTDLLNGDLSLRNFVTAFAGIGGVSFSRFFFNSLLLAVGSVVGVVLSASVTAYAFSRMRFRGRQVWFTLMVTTLLLPVHVVLVPQYIVFNQLGLVNTYVPLLIGKFLATDAFFVFLMVQFLRGIPRELDEAARIDGAGHVRIFTSIMLPLLRPAVVTSAIFAFLWSWNDFLGPLLYLNDPDTYTLPMALRLYVDQTSVSNYGAMLAMSVLALVPVLAFFVLFQRLLIDGVATQGIKG